MTRRGKRLLAIVAVLLLGIVGIGGGGFWLYYQSLKGTPQYSLALLVDAAKRDDRAAIDELVDINAVADDFMPQITAKAVELYGRGLPPQVISQLTQIAAPLMPAVKERARAELPRVIRRRTERFGNVPFFGMVLGADRYLDITIDGDTARVKSKLAEHALEVTMRKNGDRWKIVGVKEEQLATDIARAIGEQLIALATNGIKRTADQVGAGPMADLLRQAEQLIR
jgi:hypothetical protein